MYVVEEFAFKVSDIPSGGVTTATTSGEKEDVLRKDCVIVIKHTGDNCFCYALVMLMYRNHTKSKTIHMCGKMLSGASLRGSTTYRMSTRQYSAACESSI